MDKVELQVVSREIIKPSSPTPQHLHCYQLSFLDQISPSVYNPLVLFYSNDHTNSNGETDSHAADLSNRLKSSLSETLTHYYPLAGRLRENLVIDCNDEGVPFLETRVNCHISDCILHPDPIVLRKFVPFALHVHDDVILGIQFNVFECGGIAIGICLSHRVADALSFLIFQRTWAAVSRGEANVVYPDFTSATLFPPKGIPDFDPTMGIITDSVIAKRFVFRSNAIDSLIVKCGSTGMDLQSQRPPSRVEALSIFIWNRFASSNQVFSQPGRMCFMIHSVNLRKKFNPPLPEQSFGNLYQVAITFPSQNTEEGASDLARRIRESIVGINEEFVEKLQHDNEFLSFMTRDAQEMYLKGELMSFAFSSLCRFPTYETDFGYGKPIWIGLPALTFKNLVVLMDTKSGDGVEAYIHMREEEMEKLESDEEFLKYISESA